MRKIWKSSEEHIDQSFGKANMALDDDIREYSCSFRTIEIGEPISYVSLRLPYLINLQASYKFKLYIFLFT